MKTQYFKQNEMRDYWKGKCLRSRVGKEKGVALFKSLIMRYRKEALEVCL